MEDLSLKIKEKALDLGFSACGISACTSIEKITTNRFQKSIDNHIIADMQFLNRNKEKRFNPQLLFEPVKSIIVVLANYYQTYTFGESSFQIAKYALGKDYHIVIKDKLKELQRYIEQLEPNSQNRCFCDTAPVMEKYLASHCGLGWIGKNTLLITKTGSYHFIGTIFTSLNLPTEQNRENNSCSNCNLCEKACPNNALKNYQLDARKCYSYQSIENKKEINSNIKASNYIYGCDICQQVCPYNKNASPTTINEFLPKKNLQKMCTQDWINLTETGFHQLFEDSAIKRIGYAKFMNNILFAKQSK